MTWCNEYMKLASFSKIAKLKKIQSNDTKTLVKYEISKLGPLVRVSLK